MPSWLPAATLVVAFVCLVCVLAAAALWHGELGRRRRVAGEELERLEQEIAVLRRQKDVLFSECARARERTKRFQKIADGIVCRPDVQDALLACWNAGAAPPAAGSFVPFAGGGQPAMQEFRSPAGRLAALDARLEGWLSRRKTDAEAGRDYERFVGRLYELEGWEVEYNGALAGMRDGGIDLVARRAGQVRLIQCKRWSAGRVIHVNCLTQLRGSCELYASKHPEIPQDCMQGVLACTCGLAADAERAAEAMDMECRINLRMEQYPLIKCRQSDGGKTYHLPFDRDYDAQAMRIARGDFYCASAADAESRGFRRTDAGEAKS